MKKNLPMIIGLVVILVVGYMMWKRRQENEEKAGAGGGILCTCCGLTDYMTRHECRKCQRKCKHTQVMSL